MQIKITDLVGAKVISYEEGKAIGMVQDVVYDPALQTIGALVLGGDELLSAKVIPFQKIKKFADHLVIINSQKDIQRASQVITPVETTSDSDPTFLQTAVITREGTNLGKVVDLCFDTESGLVKELEVRKQNAEINEGNPISLPNVVSIQEDKVVVKSEKEISRSQQNKAFASLKEQPSEEEIKQENKSSDESKQTDNKGNNGLHTKGAIGEIITGVKEQLGFK